MKGIQFDWDNHWCETVYSDCINKLPIGLAVHTRYGDMMRESKRIIRNDYRR